MDKLISSQPNPFFNKWDERHFKVQKSKSRETARKVSTCGARTKKENYFKATKFKL